LWHNNAPPMMTVFFFFTVSHKGSISFCKRGFFIALSKYWDTAARTYERIKSKNKNVSQFKNS